MLKKIDPDSLYKSAEENNFIESMITYVENL